MFTFLLPVWDSRKKKLSDVAVVSTINKTSEDPQKTTKRISVFSPNARKYGPEKNPDSDTFHAVTALHLNWWLLTILVRLKVPIRCHSQI